MSITKVAHNGDTRIFAETGRDPAYGTPIIISIGRSEYYLGNPVGPQQSTFINATEREQLCGGAKRGAKSASLCQKLAMLACLFPGNRLGMFRQDLTDLKQSIMVTWDMLVPEELILNHHKTDRLITIRTSGKPSIMHYTGLGDEHDAESSKGKEFGQFAVDEPSEISPESYRQLLAQLCWVLPNGSRPPYMAMLGSNPEPGWVHDRFWPIIEPTENDPELKVVSNGHQIFIKFLPEDNIYLPPNWVADQEMDAPKEWVEKYLRGSWKTSTGQVFKEFDEKIHCIDVPPEGYLKSLILVASIDHGSTGTTDMLIEGIDPDGNTVSLLEYREKNKLISEHARGMAALMDRAVLLCGKKQAVDNAKKDPGIVPSFYGFEYILIDPSTTAKVNQGKTELFANIDEYRRNGIPAIPAYNALESGINLVAEYLHPKPLHRHPVTGALGSPSTFIVKKNCPGLIRDIIGLRKTITERGTVRYVGEDHGLDNKRYILMSRPEPPARTERDLLSFSTQDQLLMRTHDNWAKRFGHTGTNDNTWWGDRIQ